MADEIERELRRIDDDGALGIEAAPASRGRVCIYDTQETAYYDAAEALKALRAVVSGAGFEATWQALADLEWK